MIQKTKLLSWTGSLILCFVMAIGLHVSNGFGQITIAADDGSTYGGTLGNGSSGGYGFNSWSITYGSNTGTFVGNPFNNGMGTTNIGTTAWGFYSNGSGGHYVNATRTFSQAMAVGDIFTFDWAMNWDANAGNKGFDLLAGGSTVFNVNNGGSSTITLNGTTVNTDYGTTPMTVTLTRSSGSAYSFSMTSRSGGATYSATISSSDAIDALKIYSGDQNDGSGNRNIYFNNLKITRPGDASITGTEGWRLLASPITGATYNDLLGGLWTQCFTGADAPVAECPNGADDSNVRTLNSSGSYVSISNQGATINPGVGFAVYVYQDDDYTDSGDTGSFPKTISVSGTESTSDVSPTTFGTDGVYTLLGNPYNSTIDFDSFSKTGLSGVVYVYDHSYSSGFSGEDEANTGGAGGGWKTWNGAAGGLTDGLIAPFQGFLVVNDATSSSITIPRTSKSSSSAGLLNEPVSNPSIQLAARINNSQVSDVWFSFTETGSLEENSFDANALYALDYTPYLMFHTVSNGRALDIKNLPLDLDGEFSLPLKINGWKPVDDEDVQAYEPMGGSVEIIWPTMRNIPDEWEVRLTDHDTGTSVDLTDPSVERYEFELVVDAKSSERLPYRLAIQEAKVPEKLNSRFTLDINAVPTSIDPADELPVSVALAQNYPNPFNPATSIRFELPEAQPVMLEVFDMSGRQIATLASGVHQAGSHEVKFDASDLSSGVYLYRLQTASGTLTRKFTLLK